MRFDPDPTQDTLPHLPFFANRSIEKVRRIPTRTGGNTLWEVASGGTRYTVRRWERREGNPAVEAAVTALAAHYGIAPQVMAFDSKIPAMVTAYVAGVHRQKLARAALSRLAQVLRMLHGIDTHALDLPTIALNTMIEADRSEITLALETIAYHPPSAVLCHHDLNPGNIIWGAHTVTLIDFEYAGLNDPCFDVAAVCVEFDLDGDAEAWWLGAYYGAERPAGIDEKLAAYKVLYRALCRQWNARLDRDQIP